MDTTQNEISTATGSAWPAPKAQATASAASLRALGLDATAVQLPGVGWALHIAATSVESLPIAA